MKKVKVMLMCICLVAVASGVLAFKAMLPGNFCTTTAEEVNPGVYTCPSNKLCPNLTNLAATATVNGIICAVTARPLGDDVYTCTEENAQVKTCTFQGVIPE